MTNFMLAYYGGRQPSTKEEGMAHMEKWQAWIQSLGDAVVNPGTPLTSSSLVTKSKVTEDQNPEAMKGFAIVKAESMDAAIEIAKTDPFLEIDGTIRVSKMMELK